MWKDEEMMLRCDATNVSLRNANCWGDDIRDVQGSFSKKCQHFQEQLLRTRRTHCCQKHRTSTWRRGRFLLREAAVQHEEFLMALGIVHRGCNWVERWSLHVKCLGIAHLDRCSWKDWMEGVVVDGTLVMWDVFAPSTNQRKTRHRSEPSRRKSLGNGHGHSPPLKPWRWFVDSLGFHLGILAFQIARLRASRTHSRGQVGWFDVLWGWILLDIQSSFSASVSSTGKARWQCPRALCTDCRHAISWWSPERKARWADPIWPLVIWEHCISVFMKV